MVTLVVWTATVAASAAAAGTAQITGTIVDEVTRLPVAGVCAEVYGLTTGEVESAPTGIDGLYTNVSAGALPSAEIRLP